MNKYLFIDAVSCLDSKFIEEHIAMRKKLKTDKIVKKRLNLLRVSIIAACLAIVMMSTLVLANVFKYMSSGSYESAVTISHVLLALASGLIVASIIGVISWRSGSKYIRKRYGSCDLI